MNRWDHSDTVESFRRRISSYFVRALLLGFGLIAVLFLARLLIARTTPAGESAGGVIGIRAGAISNRGNLGATFET